MAKTSYGAGIEHVLDKISFDSNTRTLYTSDATDIQNTIMRTLSRCNKIFAEVFGGVRLGGSHADGNKIHLPDEFDMHMKLTFPFEIRPICKEKGSPFIYLEVQNWSGHTELLQKFTVKDGGSYYIDRLRVQGWLRESLVAVLPQFHHISCNTGNTYMIKYISHGYGVAHTIMATQSVNRSRKIYFDFVPVFEFQAKHWPARLGPIRNTGQPWLVIPRESRSNKCTRDTKLFMVCAPRWERLVLHKKQNLKDALRLMKAFRDANNMPALVSYYLKSLFLHEVESRDGNINWNQSPGRLLIRMLVKLLFNLISGFQPFYLAANHNNFENLGEETLQEYKRIVSCQLHKLIRRRNADYLTEADLYNFFRLR